jgi:hypothetical protein
LKAIATQQWPADLFAGASVFTGPLLAHAAADDRAAPAVSIPPAVVAQGNDKSPAPSDKTESPAATPTKDPTPPQPAPAQSAPAQVAPIPPLSSFVPPPEQITPPKDPPKQDPPPAPPLDQGGSGPVSSVPEPNGWACLLMGFGVIGATLRRARSRAGSARRDVISPPAA